MDNFEKGEKKISELLTKEEAHVDGKSEQKIEDQNAIQVKQDEADKSGQGSSKTTTVAEEKKLATLCPVCQTKAEKTCGACKSVSYCSVEHQRLDWKTHKKCCSPFIIQDTGEIGKGWIATRDLPADTILLEESPALSFSVWTSFDSPCCLTCGVAMIPTENKDRKCSTCSWPICSEKCEQCSLHLENECKFFSINKIKYIISGQDFFDFGYQVFMIRANGLKLRNKELFEKVMELQDVSECPYKNQEMGDESQHLFTRNAAILFHLDNLTRAECTKLWRAFLVNHICRQRAKAGEVRLLYLQWSRLNHSCAPNCIFSTGTPPDYRARVRTAVPVKKGESLTISYLPEFKIQPTSIRQHLLRSSAGFNCKCERCLDPAELGTFISGIKCQKCIKSSKKSDDAENVGYFLPGNPLDFSIDPLFKCNGCGDKKLFSVLKASLPPELQRAFDLDLDEIGTIENPEGFLSKYENDSGGTFLHKNHYLIHSVVKKTVSRPAEGAREFSKLELKRGVRRLEYLLQIHQKIFPGLSQPKAYLMCRLMLAICDLLTINQFLHQMSSDEIQEFLVTAQICYKGVMEYCKNDNSAEGQRMPQVLETGMNLLKRDFSRWLDPSIQFLNKCSR